MSIHQLEFNETPYLSGAGGGTRTHTTFYGPRILSPVRLPFRHTGNLVVHARVLIPDLALVRLQRGSRVLVPLQIPASVTMIPTSKPSAPASAACAELGGGNHYFVVKRHVDVGNNDYTVFRSLTVFATPFSRARAILALATRCGNASWRLSGDSRPRASR